MHFIFRNKPILLVFLISIFIILCVTKSFWRCFERHTSNPRERWYQSITFQRRRLPVMDFESRQHNLFNLLQHVTSNGLCDQDVVILLANQNKKMAHDIHYDFYQDRDTLYLTGRNTPGEIIILEKSHHQNLIRNLVFTNEIRSFNTRLNETFFRLEEVETILYHRYNNQLACFWYKNVSDFTISKRMNSILRIAGRDVKDEKVSDLGYYIQMLRLIKSKGEIQILRHAATMVSRIFEEIMNWKIEQITSVYISSYFEYRCKQMGTEGISFRPVINNGKSFRNKPHTSIDSSEILYTRNWVLLDAGCQFNGYATDMTRAWPISSHLGPDFGSMIYQIVLRANEGLFMESRVGVSLEMLNENMLRMLGEGLQSLSLIPKDLHKNETRLFVQKLCPHFVGHYIGLDVHDAPSLHSGIPLQPGMVFTIEPGIYIPLGTDFVSKDYHGISVRIENMILMTPKGPEVLTTAPYPTFRK